MSPKQRMRRGEPLPPDSALVLRGDALDAEELAGTADESFAVYAYYGISVYAEVNGEVLDTIAARKMARYKWLAVFTAGDLLQGGLELWDTGESPHYDVVHEDKVQLVVRLLGCSHRLISNPHYQAPQRGAWHGSRT